jgi:hypothetical protein
VGTENQDAVIGHLVDLFHKNSSPAAEVIHHITVVHHLMPDINRGTEAVERSINDFNGTVNTSAKAPRVGEENFHDKSVQRKDFYIKDNITTSQWMIEIHRHTLIIPSFDHTGQMATTWRLETDHQPLGQRHIPVKTTAGQMLAIVGIRLAKGFVCPQGKGFTIPHRQPHKTAFEGHWKIAIAQLQLRRHLPVSGAVHHLTGWQAQLKMQADGSGILFSDGSIHGLVLSAL